MRTYRQLVVVLVCAGGLLIAGCGDDDASTGDATATTATAESVGGGPSGGQPGGQPGGGGGGGEVDPSSIATEEELVELIGGEAACGDGSLDVHRGHMPIESELVEILGIGHDEMHVRMEEQGQNLAAVSDDLGVGADNLEDALIEHLSPAIENLVDAGTLTQPQAEAYQNDLQVAVEFRVNWDGEAEPPEICTVST